MNFFQSIATPFAFNDAMWKKYGATISRLANFTDPKTKQAPTINLFNWLTTA
jgi:hypothetical protein